MIDLLTEKKLLAAFFRSPFMIRVCAEFLEPEHFFYVQTQEVWRGMLALIDGNHTMTATAVAVGIGGSKGKEWVTDILETEPEESWLAVARGVAAGAMLRRIEQAGRAIVDAAKNGCDAVAVADTAMSLLDGALDSSAKRDLKQLSAVMAESVEACKTGRAPVHLVPCGIGPLDDCTGGFPAGLVTVIAARPSMGKSAFVLNCIANIANAGRKVLFASIEDTADRVSTRVLSRFGGVDSERLAQGRKLDIVEIERLQHALTTVAANNVWIDDSPGQSVASISRVAKRLANKGNCDILFVDHLGELTNDDKAYASTSANVRALASLAKRLNIPVVLVVQLSRAVEQRVDKTPMLSDLRDSGRIEEVARNVWLLFRPAYYDAAQDPHSLIVIVAKATHGRTGRKTLDIDLSRMAISARTIDDPTADRY